jgi:hypothetical protein
LHTVEDINREFGQTFFKCQIFRNIWWDMRF